MRSKLASLFSIAAFIISTIAGASFVATTGVNPALADWHDHGWCANHPHDSHCYHNPPPPPCPRHHHRNHHGVCVHN